MYRLATIHFVTDRQTDGQTDDTVMTIADYVAWQYGLSFISINNDLL